MPPDTGSISLEFAGQWFVRHYADQGWLAVAHLLNLDVIFRAEDPRVGILKVLGYTLEFGAEPSPREVRHWVEVEIGQRRLRTNSEIVKLAVRRKPAPSDAPYTQLLLDGIFSVLDQLDFRVELYS